MNRANGTLPRPPHHREGGFQNPWPRSTPQGFSSVVKWMLTRSREVPPAELSQPPVKVAVSAPEARSDQLAVTWIGHSSFLIQCDGLNILTDPIWSERASPVTFAGPRRMVAPGVAFDDLPDIDITLISHDHYDHFDDRTIRRLADRFPAMTWFAPLGVPPLLAQRGVRQVIELDWWDEDDVNGIRVGCTPAQHFSGRLPWNRDQTLWCGWTLQFTSTRVYFAGDTALHPEFGEIAERFGPFDLSILPIGAYEPRWFMQTVHMTPEDSVSAFRQLDVSGALDHSVMLGSHWGTFQLTDEPLAEPPVLTRSIWASAGLPLDRLWILSPGETRKLRQDR